MYCCSIYLSCNKILKAHFLLFRSPPPSFCRRLCFGPRQCETARRSKRRLREKCKSIQLKQQEQHAAATATSATKATSATTATAIAKTQCRKAQEQQQQLRLDACCQRLCAIKIPCGSHGRGEEAATMQHSTTHMPQKCCSYKNFNQAFNTKRADA